VRKGLNMGRMVFWLVQAWLLAMQGTTERERSAWLEALKKMFRKREVRIGGLAEEEERL